MDTPYIIKDYVTIREIITNQENELQQLNQITDKVSDSYSTSSGTSDTYVSSSESSSSYSSSSSLSSETFKSPVQVIKYIDDGEVSDDTEYINDYNKNDIINKDKHIIEDGNGQMNDVDDDSTLALAWAFQEGTLSPTVVRVNLFDAPAPAESSSTPKNNNTINEEYIIEDGDIYISSDDDYNEGIGAANCTLL